MPWPNRSVSGEVVLQCLGLHALVGAFELLDCHGCGTRGGDGGEVGDVIGQHRLADGFGIVFARFVVGGVDRKGDTFVFSFPSVLGGNAYENQNYQNISTLTKPSIKLYKL
jgi:hypothetical protein